MPTLYDGQSDDYISDNAIAGKSFGNSTVENHTSHDVFSELETVSSNEHTVTMSLAGSLSLGMIIFIN